MAQPDDPEEEEEEGSSAPGGGATLILGPCVAVLVGRGVLGLGCGGGGALFGCGREGGFSAVCENEAGVAAGDGEGTSRSFPFLDLDFSLTALVGLRGRATGV